MSDHFKPFCFDHPIHFDGCQGCAEAVRRAAVLASDGPIRPGYQHSTATYVEGREAPCPHGGLSRTACITCNRDGAAFRFSNDPSWPNADGLQLSAGGTATLAGPEPDAATVERCARAALDGYEGNDPPMYSSDWGQLPEDDRDAWRDVARSVLAAAGRGGK